jgi:hypothetical protein
VNARYIAKHVLLGVLGDFNARVSSRVRYEFSEIFDSIVDISRAIPFDSQDLVLDDNGIDLINLILSFGFFNHFPLDNGIALYSFSNHNGQSLVDYVLSLGITDDLVSFFRFSMFQTWHKACVFVMKIRCEVPAATVTVTENSLHRNPRWLINDRVLGEIRIPDPLVRLLEGGGESSTVLQSFIEFFKTFGKTVSSSNTQTRHKNDPLEMHTVHLRRNLRQLEKRLNNSSSEEYRNEYNRVRSLWLSTRNALNEHNSGLLREKVLSFRAQNKPFQMWSVVKSQISEFKTVSKCPVPFSVLLRHFESLYFDANAPPLPSIPVSITVDVLDSPFTPTEIQSVLYKKSSRKSTGPDGFGIDFLRIFVFDPKLMEIVAAFFNLVYFSSNYPPDWGLSYLFILFKGKGDREDPNNYRGITLASQFSKLFSSCLNVRFRSWCLTHGHISPFQSAFLPGRGAVDNIHALELIRQGVPVRAGSRRVFVATIDISKAFTSMLRSLLFGFLIRDGCSSLFMDFLKSMFATNRFALLVGDEVSEFRTVNSGVPEGDPLSPVLFNYFYDKISEFFAVPDQDDIWVGGIRYPFFLYADDFIALSLTPEGLQRALFKIEAACRFLHLKPNPSKSEISVLNSIYSSVQSIDFVFCGEHLKPVKEFRYLGPIFSSNNSWKSMRESLMLKSGYSMLNCKRVLGKFGRVNISFCLEIFDALVTSTWLYAFPVWSQNVNLEFMDKSSASFYRFLFSAPVQTKRWVLFSELARMCSTCLSLFHSCTYLCRHSLDTPSMFLSAMLGDVNYRGDNWAGHLRAKLVTHGQCVTAIDDPRNFLLNRDSFKVEFVRNCFKVHQSSGSVDSSPDTFFYFTHKNFGRSDYISMDLSTRTSVFLIRSGAWRYCLKDVSFFSQSVNCPFCDFCLTTEHLLDFCPRFGKTRDAMRISLGLDEGSLAVLFESAPIPKVFVYFCRDLLRTLQLHLNATN